MRSSALLSVLVFLYLIPLSVGAQTIDTAEKIRQVETNLVANIRAEGDSTWALKGRMAYYHIKGVSIAIVHNYKIEWAKGYGWADDSLKIPVTTQTLFQAGSISKSLNSIGVLELVQDK